MIALCISLKVALFMCANTSYVAESFVSLRKIVFLAYFSSKNNQLRNFVPMLFISAVRQLADKVFSLEAKAYSV